MKHKVTLIPGDGIGPEVVFSAKKVIDALGLSIDWEICEAGAKTFKKGIITGVPADTVESIKRIKVALKGPLETPVGFGEKSANVTLRKLFDTYGNIRPVKNIPGIQSPYEHYNIDMIIVRENVEDLYTGIEHMQTPDVAQTLKLISRWGCEKIVRLAFAIAEAEDRQKVTCATKANIMKMTEGMMKRVFEEVALEFPHLKSEHMIVDNCAHQMVMNPEQFDVVVMTNLNGDILSDLGSALVGGLGIAPGANYGDQVAIFEAVHGSAPNMTDQNRANPTAVIASSVMMLRHLGEFDAANTIENALHVTISNGRHLTEDISKTTDAGSTTEFTDAVINNLGKTHSDWVERAYNPLKFNHVAMKEKEVKQTTIGVDVFLHSTEHSLILGGLIETLTKDSGFKLKMIANRGVQVYPDIGGLEGEVSPHHQCRFIRVSGDLVTDTDILRLVSMLSNHYKWVHIERLQIMNDKPSYTKVQGEE
jgi:isocitrate dehydrogenase